MKKYFFLVISAFILSCVFAHSGRTDSSGGHTCRTNCTKYGLSYGEYHYHNSGTYSSNSTSGTNYNTYSNLNNCPLNSSFSYQEMLCVCHIGYAPSLDLLSCVKIPNNAHAVNNGQDVWVCNEGFFKSGNVCFSQKEMDLKCDQKYPGTVYKSYNDSCLCPNDTSSSSWSAETNSCKSLYEVKMESCNQKYPGTIYSSSNDKCVCESGLEYDISQKKCPQKPIITCSYTNGGFAQVGEQSAQFSVCGDDGVWRCEKDAQWNEKKQICEYFGDIVCINTYGKNSIWIRNNFAKDGKYICSCKTGYEFNSKNKCILVKNKK